MSSRRAPLMSNAPGPPGRGRSRAGPARYRPRVEELEPRIAPAVLWDGGGDGVTWQDPRNWSTDALPAASDDVVIQDLRHVTVVYSGGDTTVHSLTSHESLAVSGGSL